MRPVVMAIAACAVAAGCMTSPRVSKSGRPHTAEGIATTLRLASGDSVVGELLTLDTVTATVLVPRGIVVVPHRLVLRAEFPGYRPLVREDAEYRVERGAWTRLQLEGRYPYGIPEPALTAIMRSRNQQRVDTLGTP